MISIYKLDSDNAEEIQFQIRVTNSKNSILYFTHDGKIIQKIIVPDRRTIHNVHIYNSDGNIVTNNPIQLHKHVHSKCTAANYKKFNVRKVDTFGTIIHNMSKNKVFTICDKALYLIDFIINFTQKMTYDEVYMYCDTLALLLFYVHKDNVSDYQMSRLIDMYSTHTTDSTYSYNASDAMKVICELNTHGRMFSNTKSSVSKLKLADLQLLRRPRSETLYTYKRMNKLTVSEYLDIIAGMSKDLHKISVISNDEYKNTIASISNLNINKSSMEYNNVRKTLKSLSDKYNDVPVIIR